MIKTFLENKYGRKVPQTQNTRATEASAVRAHEATEAIANAISELANHTEQTQAHQQAIVLLKKSLRDVVRASGYLKVAKSEEERQAQQDLKLRRINKS